MNNFILYNPIKCIYGPESLLKIGKICQEYQLHHVLIVYGAQSAKANGIFDRIVNSLDISEVKFEALGGVSGALYSQVAKGIDIVKNHDIDGVIGVGGSSCMDMAKIIAFGALHDDYLDYLTFKKEYTNEKGLPVIEVPTYPSGGSEGDSAAELDALPDGGHGALYGFFPTVSILDPLTTLELSRERTARGVMVTLLQIVAMRTGSIDPLLSNLTGNLMKELLKDLVLVWKNPQNVEARGRIMYTSFLTTHGLLTSGVNHAWSGAVWEMEGVFEELLHVSYMHAFIIFMCAYLKYMGKRHPKEIADNYKYLFNLDPQNYLSLEYLNEDGYTRLCELLKQYDITYNGFDYKTTIKGEDIKAAIQDVDCGDLTKEQFVNLIAGGFIKK